MIGHLRQYIKLYAVHKVRTAYQWLHVKEKTWDRH